MNTPKYLRRTLLLAPALIMAMQSAYAGEAFQNLTVTSEMDSNIIVRDKEANLDLNRARVRVGIDLIQGIRAELAADLGSALGKHLMKDGEGVPTTFNWEKFIAEAHITFDMDELTGTPVALIVGKQSIPLTAQASKLSKYLDPNNDLAEARQVFGARVQIRPELIAGLLDSVELSAFENRSGQSDMDLTTDNPSFSVRVSKRFAEKIQVVASYARFGETSGQSKNEQQSSLALIYQAPDGYELWVEGIKLDNSSIFPDSKYSVSAGVNKDINEKTTAATAVTRVDGTLTKYRAGLIYKLSPTLTIGPEIAYVKYDEGKGNSGMEASVNLKLRTSIIPDREGQRKKAAQKFQ